MTFWDDGKDSWQWDRLTPELWARAGEPAPEIAGWIKDSDFHQWGTADEIFVSGEDAVVHKLTEEKWRRSGYQDYDDRDPAGWAKLSWAPEVNHLSNQYTGDGYAVTPDVWRYEDFPTPAVVNRFPGDSFRYQATGSDVIVYHGPTMTRPITYGEWVAAGRPAPQPPQR
ncbi:hypothetical protein [Actinokineospora pegani]|uniref:hypothetical protein n=1 Tax=Actinokineospora pegani TaxID=2654637 RepID=UPI0012EADAAD|nr:hypothetical protein [Actinokineospora pegani]